MTDSTSAGRQPEERRSNSKLRALFDTAYTMIEPFFDPEQG